MSFQQVTYSWHKFPKRIEIQRGTGGKTITITDLDDDEFIMGVEGTRLQAGLVN